MMNLLSSPRTRYRSGVSSLAGWIFICLLQETALDFWRMVVEHNVTTMVRLSGQESQSWQYWPADTGDKTLSFGYMAVTLLNRETRVSYVKREFKVNNTKVRYGYSYSYDRHR